MGEHSNDVKDRTEEAPGAVTGDQQHEGKAGQAASAIKGAVGEVKDKLEDGIEKIKDMIHPDKDRSMSTDDGADQGPTVSQIHGDVPMPVTPGPGTERPDGLAFDVERGTEMPGVPNRTTATNEDTAQSVDERVEVPAGHLNLPGTE